jgi:hypothetical protein
VVEHYEAIYNVPFYLKKEKVKLEDLVPTQHALGRAQVDSIRQLLVPIVCIQYRQKYYILDGHARSVRAKQLGMKSIEAMILKPAKNIDFGIVKKAEEMHLHSLNDLVII